MFGAIAGTLPFMDERRPAEPKDAPHRVWQDAEDARRRRLREDAARSLAVNLAEGLDLSEFLSTFTGGARKA